MNIDDPATIPDAPAFEFLDAFEWLSEQGYIGVQERLHQDPQHEAKTR